MSDKVNCLNNRQWLKICQHCRLQKCRDVGMKDEYVHNLRISRLRKPTNGDINGGPFGATLDPGQSLLTDLFGSFWRKYSGVNGERLKQKNKSQDACLIRLDAELSKIKIPALPKSGDTNEAKLSQTQYMNLIIKVTHYTV